MMKYDIDHPTMVTKLVKPGTEVLKTLTTNKCDLLHMAFGLSGEVGEAVDAIKKHVFYVQDIDRENIIEELGDIEFYMEGLRQALGVTRQQTLDANQDKLNDRYPGFEYTNTRAKERADKASGKTYAGLETTSVINDEFHGDFIDETILSSKRPFRYEFADDSDEKSKHYEATSKDEFNDNLTKALAEASKGSSVFSPNAPVESYPYIEEQITEMTNAFAEADQNEIKNEIDEDFQKMETDILINFLMDIVTEHPSQFNNQKLTLDTWDRLINELKTN